ncbi:MAG: hypothetical protein KGI29_00905 [Pseudomonadota bacterium]|nr:hypothetical protein [Pseudomonadota bacterium]MDE3038825.1 hypothetical protein [Pseudomonadota bacterium]
MKKEFEIALQNPIKPDANPVQMKARVDEVAPDASTAIIENPTVKDINTLRRNSDVVVVTPSVERQISTGTTQLGA